MCQAYLLAFCLVLRGFSSSGMVRRPSHWRRAERRLPPAYVPPRGSQLSACLHTHPCAIILSDNGDSFGAIRFNRRLPPSELAYTVQISTNLLAWNDGSFWTDFASVPVTSQTTAAMSGTQTVVRVNTPLTGQPQCFLRLRVEKQ